MMSRPTAFGWIDPEFGQIYESDRVRVIRLARRLGYRLEWACENSRLPVADQVRNAGSDVVIVPVPGHLGPLQLNALLNVADVESVLPRLSFGRWSMVGTS